MNGNHNSYNKSFNILCCWQYVTCVFFLYLKLKSYFTSTLGCMVGESVGMVEQQYWALPLRSCITMTELLRAVSLCARPRRVTDCLPSSHWTLDTWKAELWTLTLRPSIYLLLQLTQYSSSATALLYQNTMSCQCYVTLSGSGWIKMHE